MAHPHQQQIRNQWDLIVTSSSVECVSLLDEFVIEFLAYGKHGGRIIHSAINADRSCLLAQVFAAALYNFGETHDTRQSRDKFLQTARTIAQCDADTSTGSRLLDKRQLLWLDAVTCWRDAQSDRAIQHLTAIIADYPRDLFAVCQTASTHTHTQRESEALIWLFMIGGLDQAVPNLVLLVGRYHEPTAAAAERVPWQQYQRAVCRWHVRIRSCGKQSISTSRACMLRERAVLVCALLIDTWACMCSMASKAKLCVMTHGHSMQWRMCTTVLVRSIAVLSGWRITHPHGTRAIASCTHTTGGIWRCSTWIAMRRHKVQLLIG
jgi:hypothetical protein